MKTLMKSAEAKLVAMKGQSEAGERLYRGSGRHALAEVWGEDAAGLGRRLDRMRAWRERRESL